MKSKFNFKDKKTNILLKIEIYTSMHMQLIKKGNLTL